MHLSMAGDFKVPYTRRRLDTVLQVIGGSQLAVAPSYQISWGSTPWNSAGIWDGLTFRKQFEKAFQVLLVGATCQSSMMSDW
jgi:hypothetical protein